MNEFLAIDIGASSGRHILGSVRDGRLVLDEIYRFPNAPLEKNGRLVWDTERLFGEILNGLKRAKQLNRVPRFVGIDTWGVDYALLDADGNLVDDVSSYRDLRTEKIVPEVHARVPFETLYEKTGIQFQPFNTIYQLYADALAGRLARAASMLMLPDYFHYRLTGKQSREYTNATTTGLVNAHTRAWDNDIISALKYPAALFPETCEPGTKLCCFSKEIAKTVGFNAEVVLPATHDTASAVLASPFEGAFLSSGTWSLLGCVKKEPVTNETARLCNYSNEGHIGGVRLLKNIMGLWMIQQIRHEEHDRYSFAELADMARASVNDCTVDVNDARFLSPASMRREVEAAAGRRLTTGEAAYCVFNSLAQYYAQAIGELESITNARYSSLNIIGGGSQNALLNELTAQVTGRRIYTGPAEATAIGNLVVQMASAGELSDMEEAKILIKNSFDIGVL